MRLGTLRSIGAVLVDHDQSDHVGVVEKVSIDKDRKGRALVRFGKGARASEVFADVVDGIRRGISVGYRVHKFVRERVEEKIDTMRAVDWEPLEISFVAVPADTTVGVGRAGGDSYEVEVEDNPMEPKTDPTKEPAPEPKRAHEPPAPAPAPAPPVDLNHEREKARREEKARIRELQAYAEHYPQLKEDVQRAIDDGIAVRDFAKQAMDGLHAKEPYVPPENKREDDLGLSPKEIQNYSIMRAVRAIAAQKEGGEFWGKSAPFEYECSRGVEDKMDKEAKGFLVPYDVQRGGRWPILSRGKVQFRAPPMDTSENADLVATEHLAGSFIEALRAESIVLGLGARTLTGLVGNVDIPRNDTPAVFAWVAEDGAPADTELVTGTVSLTPKTIAGAVPITRRLMKQSSPDVETLVRADMILGAALAIDLGALEGTGAGNQPTGITNTAGVGTVTIAAPGNPTFTEAVEFETDLNTADALRGSLAFAVTPGVMGNMKVRTKDAGSGQFLMENGVVNGYPVRSSSQLSTNRIIFGNWTELLMGMWGVLDLNVDTATKVASGGIVLRAFQDVDIALRHAASFSINV